jgi:threonine dehydrogenase-like Zn-dependent dehydrogenase
MPQPTGKTAVFVNAGAALEIRNYPVLAPGAGGVRLRLLFSGICGTDIHILEGRLPIPPAFIPGHEFVGIVEALGEGVAADGLGSPLAVGDRAIACVALPCGHCFSCRDGHSASCLNFGVSNVRDPQTAPHFFGGFADYLQQPAATCIRVPSGVDAAAAAALPCAGPTTIRAFAVAGGITPGELVVVQGLGPVGLFAVAWAANAGATVVAIGSGASPERLAMAKAFGATEVLDYRRVPAADRLARVLALASALGRGNGADVVFEASGSPDAIPEGMNLTRTLGRYIVPGQYSSSGTVAISPELITFKALKIIGSGQYKLADIAEYLSFLQRHKHLQQAFAASISHRFAVAQANEAVAAVSAGKVIKAVFAGESAA